jgi:hypothetical protein
MKMRIKRGETAEEELEGRGEEGKEERDSEDCEEELE